MIGYLLLQRQHLLLGGAGGKMRLLSALTVAVHAAREAHPEVASGIVLPPAALLACGGRLRSLDLLSFGSGNLFVIRVRVLIFSLVLWKMRWLSNCWCDIC